MATQIPLGIIIFRDGVQVQATQDNISAWSMNCPLCNKFIKLGPECNQYNGSRHYNSTVCKLEVKRCSKAQQREATNTLTTQGSSGHPHNYNPQLQAAGLMSQLSIPSAPALPPLDELSKSITPTSQVASHTAPTISIDLDPPSEQAKPVTDVPASAPLPTNPQDVEPFSSSPSSPSGQPRCCGWSVAFPSIYSKYAFAAHNKLTLKWKPIQFHDEDDKLTFCASKCKHKVVDMGTTCIHCHMVSISPDFTNFLQQANQTTEQHAHFSYYLLTHEQMEALARKLAAVTQKVLLHVCASVSITFISHS
jgi:hypothetical protein